MFKTLKNAWSIAEIRQKLMFTALILLLFRIGSVVPVPFVDVEAWGSYFETALSGTILGLYDTMSGLSSGTVLSLGIQPYINSSIIVQLLCVAIPALERMAKEEGEEGKKKINNITRWVTVGLGLLMGFAYFMMLKNNSKLLTRSDFLAAVVIIMTFTAGSAVVMWLGEQITEHGIGNGISMILFAGIVARIPSIVGSILDMKWWLAIIVGIFMIALAVFIVYINDAERRIPIQYAKRVVGRKIYGGQSTNMPIKVAMSGVMPVIFASSICSLPATICMFAGWTKNWAYNHLFQSYNVFYILVYGAMIFFFSWFYSTIQYDPVEISNNLKSNGGFIPGFRPGKPTSDFIKKVIAKLVVFGAVYLAVVSLLPLIASAVGQTAYNAYVDGSHTTLNATLMSLRSLSIGGTSVIIMVSVALETVKALEAQMLMRHYKGFLD